MKLSDVTDFIGITDSKANQPVPSEGVEFDREELGPKKVIHAWEATPKAPLVSIAPRYRKTFMVLGAVIVFILVLMQEFWLILLIVSMFFLNRVMSQNPLDRFRYEITNHGISINGQMYYWDELTRFFFSDHFGGESLAVDTKTKVPPRLIIYFNNEDKHKIIDELNKHIDYLEQEPLTFADKAYTTVMDKFDFKEKK